MKEDRLTHTAMCPCSYYTSYMCPKEERVCVCAEVKVRLTHVTMCPCPTIFVSSFATRGAQTSRVCNPCRTQAYSYNYICVLSSFYYSYYYICTNLPESAKPYRLGVGPTHAVVYNYVCVLILLCVFPHSAAGFFLRMAMEPETMARNESKTAFPPPIN